MNIRDLAKAIHVYYIENCYWPRPDQVEGVVEKLGNGSFGAAYLLPDGRVLKVSEELDATCVWIAAAAKHFAEYGEPGRCMPVVWEFDTMLDEKTVIGKRIIQAESFVRMPDGSLARVSERSEDYTYPESRAWWFAVMEKVEAHNNLPWEDNDYVTQWGHDRGIYHCDIYAKNCGIAADGRKVTFDPFWQDPGCSNYATLKTVSTGYTGPRAYTATPMETPRRAKLRAVDEFMRSFDAVVASEGMRGAFNRMMGQRLNMQIVKKRDVGQLGRINAELTFGAGERRILGASNREKRRESPTSLKACR